MRAPRRGKVEGVWSYLSCLWGSECLKEDFGLRALLEEAGRRGAEGDGSEPSREWTAWTSGREAQLLSTRTPERAGQCWAVCVGRGGQPRLPALASAFLSLDAELNTWHFFIFVFSHSGKPSACQSYRISCGSWIRKKMSSYRTWRSATRPTDTSWKKPSARPGNPGKAWGSLPLGDSAGPACKPAASVSLVGGRFSCPMMLGPFPFKNLWI